MNTNSFIIKTQLIAPKLKKDLLRRERLLSLLQKGIDKKLILITAGAGYGKTTLLAQFVNELMSPFVFYTISKEDGNLIPFLTYIITGIRKIYKNFGPGVQSVMERINPINPNIQMLMGTFINELVDTVKKELFIIIDDYHLIDKTIPINKAMDYFLEHIPHNIHFIISSRTLLPLSITKLRAKDELLELNNDDLKFTRDEIQKLFKEIYKLNISKSLMEKMEHCFEGWITALQLVSHLMRKEPQKALDRIEYSKENLNYFANEVFKQQSKEIQNFLIKSSILDQLTPKSCNVILKINNSYEILEYLTNKNLFISCLNGEKELFYYHQLFRNFLLNKLTKAIGNKALWALHLRAGNYFKSIKDYSNSIQHYILAKEVKKAIEIIEKEGKKLLSLEKYSIVEQWLKWLPADIVQSNPTFLIFQGSIFKWQGKLDEAMESFKKAKIKFMKKGEKEEVARAMLLIVNILFYRGRYIEAIKVAKKAYKMIEKEQSPIKAKLVWMTAGCYADLFNYRRAISTILEAIKINKKMDNRFEKKMIKSLVACYINIGEIEKAIKIGEQLIKEEENTIAPYISGAYQHLGCAYALKGNLLLAKQFLQKALQINKTLNHIIGMYAAFGTLGFINLIIGNYELTRLYCNKVLKFCAKSGMEKSGLQVAVLLHIADSYLFERNLARAEEYINKIIPQDKKFDITGKGGFLITKGEIKLELGALEEAEKILNLALKDIQKSQNKLALMLVHTALAKLYYKKNVEANGRSPLQIHLKRALELSKKHNYHFALIRLGRISTSLLRFAIKNSIIPHYAEFLLKEIYAQYDLIVKTFGGLEIWRNNKKLEENKWRTQRAKLLFCYLVINREKWVTRDKLAELLWPGGDFSKTRINLRYNISCIRDMINSFTHKNISVIEYKNEAYRINPKYKIWTDFLEFEDLIQKAEQKKEEQNSISDYESAINLYKGDFLVNMYDDWSEERRLFYKEQYIEALDNVANFYLKEHKFKKVIEYCKKIISISRLHENAYFMAIQSYISLGRRKSAIDLYKQLEKILKTELNLEPSPKIKNLITNL